LPPVRERGTHSAFSYSPETEESATISPPRGARAFLEIGAAVASRLDGSGPIHPFMHRTELSITGSCSRRTLLNRRHNGETLVKTGPCHSTRGHQTRLGKSVRQELSNAFIPHLRPFHRLVALDTCTLSSRGQRVS